MILIIIRTNIELVDLQEGAVKRTQIDARSIFREAVRMCTFDHYLIGDISQGTDGCRRDKTMTNPQGYWPLTVLRVHVNDDDSER
mgnify:CR=1 FL=1